jgi:hypothetical protein
MKDFIQWVEDLQTLQQQTAKKYPNSSNWHNATDTVPAPTKGSFSPHPENRTLVAQGVMPSSDGQGTYQTKIIFKNVEFLPIPRQMQLGYKLLAAPGGHKYYFKKPSLSGTDVDASCTCPAFTNSSKKPGQEIVCKHIMRLAKYLKDDKDVLAQDNF